MITHNILFQLVVDILTDCPLILPHRVYIIAPAPKMPVPTFIFQIGSRSNIIKLLLLFRYPINCDTLMCGGIDTNMWMWSGQHSAAMISTRFRSLSSRRIFPTSAFISRYITCLRYFGNKKSRGARYLVPCPSGFLFRHYSHTLTAKPPLKK